MLSKHYFLHIKVPSKLKTRLKTTTYAKNSFKEYTAVVLWKDQSDDFRKITNFNQFKNILQSRNDNECKCNACKQF